MDAQERRRTEREALGGKPTMPEDDELREKCETDRESLSPRETAGCAGADIAELYENEEDGGS